MMVTWHLILIVLAIASLTEARIKIKKIEINTDPNYLKIQHTLEERDNIPYLSVQTEILQDIDGEIIVNPIKAHFWIFFRIFFLL